MSGTASQRLGTINGLLDGLSPETTHWARYEFKYLLRPEQLPWVRDLAWMYCDVDPYGEDALLDGFQGPVHRLQYDVCSLYLDSWDWKLALQTIEGVRTRTKMRIRTYGFTDDMPVFAEDKGRVGTTILKSRALIPRSDWAALVGEAPPPKGGFQALKASHQADYDGFRNTIDLLDLRPRLWVMYKREAYQSRYGDGARLTFDLDLRVQPAGLIAPDRPDPSAWQRVQLDGPPSILELKFNGAFPAWMQRLVNSLGLRRVSCSKYVQGVQQVGNVPWHKVERSEPWMAF